MKRQSLRPKSRQQESSSLNCLLCYRGPTTRLLCKFFRGQYLYRNSTIPTSTFYVGRRQADGQKLRRYRLLDGHALRKISWLVDVAAAADGDVVGEELEGDDFEDGEEELGGGGDF